MYAGMMQYDGDLGIPKKFLVSPPAIDKTMSEYLSNSNISQYAISETQKYGHVTYFLTEIIPLNLIQKHGLKFLLIIARLMRSQECNQILLLMK